MKHANKVNMHLNDYPFRFFKLSLFIHGEVYLIQHYVIKFVSDLRQVGSFLHK